MILLEIHLTKYGDLIMKHVMRVLIIITICISFCFESYSETTDYKEEANKEAAIAIVIGVVAGLAIGIPIYVAINKKKMKISEMNKIYAEAEEAFQSQNFSLAIEKYSLYIESYDKKNISRMDSEQLNQQYKISKEKINKINKLLDSEK
ncbi:MAG: hypothetical protein ACFFC1_07570 [Promethearchaeota archaeon]